MMAGTIQWNDAVLAHVGAVPVLVEVHVTSGFTKCARMFACSLMHQLPAVVYSLFQPTPSGESLGLFRLQLHTRKKREKM